MENKDQEQISEKTALKSHIRESLLIPDVFREVLLKKELSPETEAMLYDFFDEYLGMEQKILKELNDELSILSKQMMNHIEQKEKEEDQEEVGILTQDILFV